MDDASGSVGPARFETTLTQLQSTIDNIGISHGGARVGIVKFAKKIWIESELRYHVN